MKKTIKTIAIIIAVILLFILLACGIYEMIDFYNDYKCTTTTDIDWFINNNCMRYYK